MIVKSAQKSSPKKMNTIVSTEGETLSISSVSKLYTRRALATAIDCTAVLLVIVGLYVVAYFQFKEDFFMLPIVSWVPLAVYPLLSAYFESSDRRATPGKRALGLVVCDENGQKLSFARSLGRNFSKSISLIAFSVPITFILFSSRFQSLHDKLCKTYVTARDFEGSPKRINMLPQTEVVSQANPVGNRVICTEVGGNLECAPINLRMAAAFLDAVAFYSVQLACSCFLMSVILDVFGTFIVSQGTYGSLAGGSAAALVAVLISTMLTVGVMTLLEASQLQATPGKIICGLKTTNLQGDKISLKDSLFKQFMQGLVYLCMFPTVGTPGLLIIAILKKYNLPAEGIPLICGLAFYIAYGSLLCATLIKSNQSVVDKLSNRFVVIDNPRKGPIQIT
ncbi:MAG: RDD family protein [Leptolyngbya sp.]|nr:RDD family protein [Candidatus Melainabacteria bacterium]